MLGGELERPIHHAELIYDVTLKWSTWAEMDRRNTYLLLKRNAFFEEAVPAAVPPISIFGEAYYGSPSSRSVKLTQSVQCGSHVDVDFLSVRLLRDCTVLKEIL